MKTIHALLILIVLFSNCKKDVSSCKEYKQKDVRENLIDPTTIDIPEFTAFLTQYSYLKPYEFNSDQYSSLMKCYVFYKGIPVLTDQYIFSKNKSTNEVIVMDTLRSYDLPVSTNPGVSYTDAIEKAKEVMNFDHTCIVYSLGIYDTSLQGAYHPNNYVLVWKIEGSKGYPLVIVDANTKQIYRSLDELINFKI